MLKFFRKIRQQLAYDNNLSKYSRYAIGEIFLVVIGILIALQINNWNQARLENNERLKLLNALKLDLSSLQTRSSQAIIDSELQGKYLLELLDVSAGVVAIEKVDSVQFKLQNSLMNYFFDSFSTTYEQAKSSGKLSLIKNEQLLMRLSKSEENFKGLKSVESPVFNESYEAFNASVHLLERINVLSNGLIISPTPHPDIALTPETLESFLQSEANYQKLYHLYFLNTLTKLWWQSLDFSVKETIKEIEISLKS